jgi:hypothetical protein
MDGRIILKWASKNSGLIAWLRIWTTEHSVWYIFRTFYFSTTWTVAWLLSATVLVAVWIFRIRCESSRPTPCSTVRPSSKLILSPPLKQLPHFYETRSFLAVLTRSPPLVPILSQTNPLHAITFYFFTVYFNIILPCSQSRLCKWSFSFKYQPKPCKQIFLQPSLIRWRHWPENQTASHVNAVCTAIYACVYWHLSLWVRACVCVCPQKCTLVASYHAVGMSSVCLSVSPLSQLISSTAVLRCAVRGSMPGRSPLFTSRLLCGIPTPFPCLSSTRSSAQLIKLSLMLFINTSSTSWQFYAGAFARTIASSYPSVRAKQRASKLTTFPAIWLQGFWLKCTDTLQFWLQPDGQCQTSDWTPA